ncbi:hypothetical protein DUI87_01682 [Hirundo rustica rustica]|uniref:Uncharacterized protein n=1 Tax=Hirundo rustica rustica TaxID=333673 RepID=A0A3M0L5Q3_HIRRU|nr:hypothetical protein DUI87_01682 [Hirundo rustica rustica]
MSSVPEWQEDIEWEEDTELEEDSEEDRDLEEEPQVEWPVQLEWFDEACPDSEHRPLLGRKKPKNPINMIASILRMRNLRILHQVHSLVWGTKSPPGGGYSPFL